MAEFESKTIPLQEEGIHIDAESVRAELEDAPESHDLTRVNAELIANLDDDEINRAIRESADDNFWAAYDELRRNAIARLARNLGLDNGSDDR
ncbi:hypothetical protein [Streptomyces sp. NPDC052042]|uniref:hypothetical protein n=1 Tax=Streptomyces sp. NPDC052042 TaxID=3365683 RepID=UPI0037D3ADA5